MDSGYIPVLEAMIFASDEPISSKTMMDVIKELDGADTEISTEHVKKAVEEINIKYDEQNLPFRIIAIAEGYVYATKPEYSKYVGLLSTEKSKRRLSQAALETLAIIAYKQPITKPELESLRGVNSDYTVNTLLEKNLITIKGRAETMGRPLIYGTTTEFLVYFGLNSINDLPKPRELEEIVKDEDFIEQKRKIMMNLFEDDMENELNKGGKNEDSAE